MILVNELSNGALSYWVGRAINRIPEHITRSGWEAIDLSFNPSLEGNLAIMLQEEYKIDIFYTSHRDWRAEMLVDGQPIYSTGHNVKAAICQVLVVSVFGDSVNERL